MKNGKPKRQKSLRERINNAAKAVKSWENEEIREKRVKAISEGMKKLWATPNFRLKMLKACDKESVREGRRRVCKKRIDECDAKAIMSHARSFKKKTARKRDRINTNYGVVFEEQLKD